MRMLLILCVSICCAITATSASNIWPLPSLLSHGEQYSLVNSSDFKFVASGVESEILTKAFERYHELIFEKKQIFIRSSSSIQRKVKEDYLKEVRVNVLTDDEELQLGVEESYTLSISGTSGTITAQTVFGAIWGLETFSQLVKYVEDDEFIIEETPIEIQDRPRFAWRGMLIDTSRHFFPTEFLLKTIDALSYAKMNVFHWHVIDADSFPIYSETYPELTEKGAYSQWAVYSQEDVQTIIKHAKERGVRVVIEFDIPGHSSFGYAFPEIVGCPHFYDDEYIYQKQSVALDPTVDKTYEVLFNLFKEFETVFPDAYFHLGGDEVRHVCWESKPEIKQFMDANGIPTYEELEKYFWRRLGEEVLVHLDKTVIVWDDTFVNEIPVPQNALIHVWQQDSYMADVIKAGKQVIRSNGWYLDQAVPGDYRYRWLETWIDFYELEPIPQGLTEEEEQLVIGGEACMWTEQVDSHTFSALVWPRSSCTAERLWSHKSVNDSTAAIPRLLAHRCSLHLRGIDASPIFPDYCEREDPTFNPKGNMKEKEHIFGDIQNLKNQQSQQQQQQFREPIFEKQSTLSLSLSLSTPSNLTIFTAFICGAGLMFFVFLSVFSLRRFFKSSTPK